MRYETAPNTLFIKNRQNFIRFMKSKSLAIFTSNDVLPTNADGHLPFIQNRDLLYLSGINQEETILILFPDAFDPKHREILFVRETNETIAIWEGAKLNKSEATEVSGIANVQWNAEFEKMLHTLIHEAENVYLNRNEHLRAHVELQTREDRLAKWIMEKYPLHKFERSAPIMHQLRSVKQEEEVLMMQKAADLNAKAYKRVLNFIKPGITEFEIEAEFLHEYIRNGSSGFSYTPIIASGSSACVLHYIENKNVLKEGDLLLLDVGCWYAHYASDVTRCFPVNGKFSARQKQVYEAVLRVQKEAIAMLRPGNQLHEYHREVGKIMEAELLDLKLIDKTDIKNQNPNWPAYKKYFMHGTSHYLGLDVHDVGLWNTRMEAGNVFTVEPGIYIQEEGLGIRIEDNICIGLSENQNLTVSIPKEIEEIEAVMNQK